MAFSLSGVADNVAAAQAAPPSSDGLNGPSFESLWSSGWTGDQYGPPAQSNGNAIDPETGLPITGTWNQTFNGMYQGLDDFVMNQIENGALAGSLGMGIGALNKSGVLGPAGKFGTFPGDAVSVSNDSNSMRFLQPIANPGSGTQTPQAPVGPTPEELAAQQAARLNDARTKAITDALDAYMREVGSRGLNINDNIPTGRTFQQLGDSEINRMASGVNDPEGFASVFTPNFEDTILNNERDAVRNTYGTQLRSSLIDPNSYFGQNFGSDVLDRLITEGRNPVQTQLDNAKARGSLNDTGYNTAANALGNQVSGVRSKLGTAKDDIVSGYKSNLQKDINSTNERASSYDFGSNSNPTQAASDVAGRGETFKSGFEGDIRNSIGSPSSLFDVPDLMNTATRTQGLINPRGSVVSALAERRKSTGRPDRGLGSTGAF